MKHDVNPSPIAYAELSFAQQRLWLVDRITGAGGTVAYTIPLAYRIPGRINVSALRKALAEIVARHEILRTIFITVNGHPYQAISASNPFDVPFLDLLGHPDPESQARQIAADEALRPFDLEKGPLFRAMLLALAPDDHVLLITMHHIVADGWSIRVLESELVTLYLAFSRGESSPLTPLSFQYADFATWQRSKLSGKALDRDLSYWRTRLDGAPYYLDLPMDYPRPRIPSFEGGIRTFFLDSDVRKGLSDISKRTRSTLFMTILGAFQALLAIYAQTEDVVVGAPVSGRTRPELEGLIGFFVNALVLRTNLAGDPSFLEIIARARDTALGAFAHQELPFERLVEEISPPRTLSYNPLVQVGFQVIHPPIKKEGHDVDLVLSSFTGGFRPSARFDLELQVSDRGDTAEGVLFYDSALFEDRSVEQLISRFLRFLRSVVTDGSTRLSEFNLLGDDERRMILESWNATTEIRSEESLLDRISVAARKAPDAIALRCGSESLTYAELVSAVQLSAANLLHAGVGPEQVVGVCVKRSLSLALALMGILEAGACVLYLDPDYPQERLEFILANSSPLVVVTDEDLLPRLASARAVLTKSKLLDKHPDVGTDQGNRTRTTGRMAAYIVYTSGTTGGPKGVVVERQSFLNHCRAAIDSFLIEARDIVLQLAPFSFDPSLAQLIAPLMCGAQVVLRGETQWSAEEIWQVIDEYAITVINTAPSHFGQLMEARPDTMGRLRLVVLGGEALDPEVSSGWLKLLESQGIELWNAYGPTEATISSTWERLTADGVMRGSIGRPISNVRVYVLDSNRRLSPPGIPGELHVGGVAVARGYLGQPRLTASRFVPDEFGDSGNRLYCTGDRALWLGDGQLRFLGRLDNQVKIRGVRIELNEVENKLLLHPKLANAVVTVEPSQSSQTSDSVLSAYIVSSKQSEVPTAHELRQFLRRSLPDPAVPTKFLQIDEIPLLSSGRVDYSALAAHGQPLAGRERIAPREEVEAELKSIWSQVLDEDSIGVFDDFFDLGGHSLLVPRLLALIADRFGMSLPLQAVFDAPTIAEMADLLRTVGVTHSKDAALPEGVVQLAASGKTSRTVVVHGVDGTLNPYFALTRNFQREFDVYGVAPSAVRSPSSARSIKAMAREYVEQLKKALPSDPDVLIGWSMGGVLAHEMVREMPNVRLLVLVDAPTPETWSAPQPQQAAALLADEIMARRPQVASRHSSVRESLEMLLVDHLIALSRFRPSYWPGQALIVSSSITSDASERGHWSGLVSVSKTLVLDGDHFSLLDEPYACRIYDAVIGLIGSGAPEC